MFTRRDVILSGGMAVAAAGAFAFTPRRELNLLGDKQLDKLVPLKIGSWSQQPSSAFVLPKTEGSLSDRLYNQLLTRLYQSDQMVPVMLVMAYGATQNDQLQLHRPEVCYTAVGFQIVGSAAASVELAPGAVLPVRELAAKSDSRIEPILYWTRIGDDLPTDGRQQRSMKLAQSMRGYIPDGILVRISTVAEPSPEVFAQLGVFARELLMSIAPANRQALIGRPLAQQLNTAAQDGAATKAP
mgnify:CR=1|jgi:EpsI family protein